MLGKEWVCTDLAGPWYPTTVSHGIELKFPEQYKQIPAVLADRLRAALAVVDEICQEIDDYV